MYEFQICIIAARLEQEEWYINNIKYWHKQTPTLENNAYFFFFCLNNIPKIAVTEKKTFFLNFVVVEMLTEKFAGIIFNFS